MENEEIMTVSEPEVDNEVNEGDASVSVPDELQGLSSESIKELMKEMEPEPKNESEPEQESELEPETEEEVEPADEPPVAEPGSVNTQDNEVVKKSGQKIPYERFKEVLDKNNNMKEELEQLKAELAKARTQQPRQQAEAPQPQTQVFTQQPAFNVTPEMSEEIESVVKQQALSMSGLTEEDLESLEYMDDDDSRKVRWEQARRIAESTVYNHIAQVRAEQANNARRLMEIHQQAINSYNEFTVEQQADPDFENIVNFANTDYFNGLPDEDKPVIAEAYLRCQHQTASPQDMAVIKRYFLDAKNEYRKNHNDDKAPKKSAKNVETKLTQSKAFPRASQVNGSAGSTGAPSVDALERMLNEVSWDEIPQEYKDLVMNAGLI